MRSAARPTPAKVVFAALIGRSAAGLAGPRDAVEVGAVHLSGTTRLLALGGSERTHLVRATDKPEVRYRSHDLGAALRALAAADLAAAELFLGSEPLLDSWHNEPLLELARASLSVELAERFIERAATAALGFSVTRNIADALDIIRRAHTAAHLLRCGQLVISVPELASLAGAVDVLGLATDAVRNGSGGAPAPPELAKLATVATERAARAAARPAIPPFPANRGDIEEFLMSQRRRYLRAPDGAFAVVFDPDGRVLLAHRRDRDEWDLPGGGIDHGESPWAAVVRETFEETGLAVRVEHLVRIEQLPLPRGHRSFTFLCRPVDGEIGPSDEMDEVRWFDVGSYPDKLPDSRRYRIQAALRGDGCPELIDLTLDPNVSQWLG